LENPHLIFLQLVVIQTPEGLYETKCYSQEKINSCSDIGWILHIETGKAKGCLEDEMCCKRLLPDALS